MSKASLEKLTCPNIYGNKKASPNICETRGSITGLSLRLWLNHCDSSHQTIYSPGRRERAMLRLIYMGTPQLARPPLEAHSAGARPGLVLPEGYEIATVITLVDKPAGRGREIVYSPVKHAALTYGIPVCQPGSLKRAENIEALAAYPPDL